MDPDIIKIIATVVIFLTAYVSGMLPVRLGASEGGEHALMLGLSFAGGVFLAAGLVHLLPEAIEKVGALGLGGDFPLAGLLCGAGVLAVLMFEKVAAGSQAADAESGRQGYLLLTVLAVHSLIAGAALGLEQVGSTFIMILIAILAHKGFAAFALGVSFARSTVPVAKFRQLLLFFSCTTPVGLLIGLVAADLMRDEVALHVEAIFDALAAGTFLYVATLDLMHDAFEETKFPPTTKFVSVLVGFSFMSVLALWG